MQAKLTTRPQHEVIAAIHALDLQSIKDRMMDAELGEGWSREHAEGVEAEYKLFLTMLVKYPADIENILISKDVDEFWHSHILHTTKYADDCQKVFGNFLHHNPQARPRSAAEIRKRLVSVERTSVLNSRERDAAKAYCNATAEAAAYCNATVGKAAYCNATAEAAAYCNATVGKAAYCNATAAEAPAYCNATVEKSAYCNATVGKASYCNAIVHPDTASYCNATARADHSYCNAAAHRTDAAYCNATVEKTV